MIKLDWPTRLSIVKGPSIRGVFNKRVTCKFGFYVGSCALLVKVLVAIHDAFTQQVKLGAAEHLAFEKFEAIHMALGRSVAPFVG